MTVNIESTIDSLTTLVRAIEDDGKLRRWFFSLAKKSIEDRRNEIYAMSKTISSKKLRADLVASFKLLADPRIFAAACQALGES